MYTLIFYSSKALSRDKKRLLKNFRALERIEKALARLALDPFAFHLLVKKLHHSLEGTFRLRVSDWRILFDIDTGNKKIIIYRIKQRKEGYE